MNVYKLSANCTVAGQILASDVVALAADGFTTIICNRPDGEDIGQPTADEIAAECASNDLVFHHIPVSNSGLTMDAVERFRDAVTNSKGPVLAYCRSGQRCSVIWQASGAL
jgi:sulfide:quinone oxidoreductase